MVGKIDVLGILIALLELAAVLAVLWLVWRMIAFVLLLIRRICFAGRLERFCQSKKLRLEWLRPKLASVFGGVGEVDFVVDERIHVVLLSTVRRRVQYQLGEDNLLLLSMRGMSTGYHDKGSTANRVQVVARDSGNATLSAKGSIPHALGRCDVPDGNARVLVVYPAPMEVNDCTGARARPLGSGDGTVGGFQFNTRSQFFERLAEYAKTGEMGVWTPNKQSRKFE